MGAFEYRQAEEIRDVFARHDVRYLFLGKSGAILLGFPDTTQDADVFIWRDPENGRRTVSALAELGFTLSDSQSAEIERGKDFIQLKNGPFDLDLIFAPDGIERFDDARQRRVTVAGFPSATSTTSLRAKRPQAARRIANHSRAPQGIPRVLASTATRRRWAIIQFSK